MQHGRTIILCLLLAFGQAGTVCAELAAAGIGPHSVMTDMAADEPEDCRSGHACHDAPPAAESATGCACGDDALLAVRVPPRLDMAALQNTLGKAMVPAIACGGAPESPCVRAAPDFGPITGIGPPSTLFQLGVLLLL